MKHCTDCNKELCDEDSYIIGTYQGKESILCLDCFAKFKVEQKRKTKALESIIFNSTDKGGDS